MPIKIYKKENPKSELAWLCDDDWALPSQIAALDSWLKESGQDLPPGDYIADVGFQWRRDAGGGGSSLSPEVMKIMAEAGIWLYLSEYPGYVEDDYKRRV